MSLQRLGHWVASHSPLSTGVHTPRIGARMPGVSWYAVERLLIRYLCQRAIRVIVHYFNRQGALARSQSTQLPASPSVPTTPTGTGTPPASLARTAAILDRWISQGTPLDYVHTVCPAWQENVAFICSQSPAALRVAMSNISAEIAAAVAGSDEQRTLQYFLSVMTDVFAEK